jgi:hypothetical protein
MLQGVVWHAGCLPFMRRFRLLNDTHDTCRTFKRCCLGVDAAAIMAITWAMQLGEVRPAGCAG